MSKLPDMPSVGDIVPVVVFEHGKHVERKVKVVALCPVTGLFFEADDNRVYAQSWSKLRGYHFA